MFERAVVFSALIILICLTWASLAYYQHLESRRQAEVEVVQEQE